MQPMLTVALTAARKASQMVEHAIERLDKVNIETKAQNDFVTKVDRDSEKEILYHLQKAFPEHQFIGEETGQSGAEESDYQWLIDPLDGTTNFIHGIPHFAVSIACLHKGRLEHAVIIDPMKREEYTASRGQGAQLNGRRIRVSNRLNLDGALIGTGIPFSGFALENIENYTECLKEIAGQTAGIRRPGAAALDLAYVAAGRFDGFWEMNLKPWDIAAGILLIQEAGGLVSDFQGGSNFLKQGHIVCGTPNVFKKILPIVKKHLGNI